MRPSILLRPEANVGVSISIIQEDSFKLWTTIVTNKLLRDTNLILFLNKIDLLRSKLESGIKLKEYVVSYGDRPNDLDSATACECLLSKYLLFLGQS